MDNETKLSSEQINTIMEDAKKQNINGKLDADEFMKKHLSESQAQKVKSVLSDPEKMKELLASPFAKKFMKAMNEKKEDG